MTNETKTDYEAQAQGFCEKFNILVKLNAVENIRPP